MFLAICDEIKLLVSFNFITGYIEILQSSSAVKDLDRGISTWNSQDLLDTSPSK